MARLEIRYKDKQKSLKSWFLALDGNEVDYKENEGHKGDYRLLWAENSGPRYEAKDIQIYIYNEKLEESILKLNVGDVEEDIKLIKFLSRNLSDEIILHACFERAPDKSPELLVAISCETTKWKKPWSVEEFWEQSKSEGHLINAKWPIELGYLDQYESPDKLVLIYFPQGIEESFEENVRRRFSQVEELITIVESKIQDRLNENSLIQHFNFPPQIRGACEEYLWSFIQFLKDVGVEATAELKHEGQNPGQVLFAVTPTQGKEALGKIRQALDLYLNLAGVTNFESDPSSAIQVVRLESRILYFQSQLKLAQAEVKAQLAEIQSQHTTIKAQEATLLAQAVSLERVSASNVFLLARIDLLERKKKDEEITLFDGLFKIKDPDFWGVSVNLTQLLSMLKKIMIEEDKRQLPTPERPALPPKSEHD